MWAQNAYPVDSGAPWPAEMYTYNFQSGTQDRQRLCITDAPEWAPRMEAQASSSTFLSTKFDVQEDGGMLNTVGRVGGELEVLGRFDEMGIMSSPSSSTSPTPPPAPFSQEQQRTYQYPDHVSSTSHQITRITPPSLPFLSTSFPNLSNLGTYATSAGDVPDLISSYTPSTPADMSRQNSNVLCGYPTSSPNSTVSRKRSHQSLHLAEDVGFMVKGAGMHDVDAGQIGKGDAGLVDAARANEGQRACPL